MDNTQEIELLRKKAIELIEHGFYGPAIDVLQALSSLTTLPSEPPF